MSESQPIDLTAAEDAEENNNGEKVSKKRPPPSSSASGSINDIDDGEDDNDGDGDDDEGDEGDDAVVVRQPAKRVKTNAGGPVNIWIVCHRLEPGGYQCVGDYENEYPQCASHSPSQFDTKILGTYSSLESALAHAADAAEEYFYGVTHDGCEDDCCQDSATHLFSSYQSGVEMYGSVHTFSQRIYVQKLTVAAEY
jgi:hypothetical protein